MSASETRASSEIIDVSAAPSPKPKTKKKTLIIAGAAAAAVLLGGGGAALALSGGDDDGAAHAAAAPHDQDENAGETEGETFVDVPPMIINLRSTDASAHLIKLHVMLVPGPKGSEATIKAKLPLLLDAYQPFLRELRPEDLAGSAAVFRIKEELLVRATDSLGTGQVKDVLIQDLVQQ